jgi:HlyD family secretion protein
MKRVLTIVGLVGIVGVGAAALLERGRGGSQESYRLVQVTRGDVQQTVSATGTLNAVRTVQVGTQVSGQIAELDADFNSHVRRGQVVARLDTTLLAQAVASAQTDLARAQAGLEQTRFLAEQADRLHAAASMTDTDWRTAQYNYQVAQASLQASRIALQRAQQNLDYAVIRSPIDGVVIERDVDVGQTVAASFSAPQLFLIAEDLHRMQILASVDESDIGAIKNGQPVTFTVQAYPDRGFTGRVEQVRMQSKTTDNVVNYTVVVAVDNPDGALLPGMTATLSFETAKATDVFRVANAALRFRPTTEMVAEVRAERREAGDSGRAGAAADSSARAAWRARMEAGAGGTDGVRAESAAGRTGAGWGAGQSADVATLWYLDAQGRPQVMRVRKGLTDGQVTEVTGRQLREGMEIIAGTTSGTAAQSTMANPFQSQDQGRRGPRGGF